MKTVLAAVILTIVAVTTADSAARKPEGRGDRQLSRACGKLPYGSFLECRDHFLKIGYGIQVTAPFCQYHCPR